MESDMKTDSGVCWDDFYDEVTEPGVSVYEAEKMILQLSRFGYAEDFIYCLYWLNYQNAVLLIDRFRAAGNSYTVLDLMTNLDPDYIKDREKLLYLILHADDLTSGNYSDLAPFLYEEELSWLAEVLYE